MFYCIMKYSPIFGTFSTISFVSHLLRAEGAGLMRQASSEGPIILGRMQIKDKQAVACNGPFSMAHFLGRILICSKSLPI